MTETGTSIISNYIHYKHFANMKGTSYGHRLPRGTQVKKRWAPLPKRKGLLGRHRNGWENNIKMNLEEIGYESWDFIHLV
jgi:hypothetical protein